MSRYRCLYLGWATSSLKVVLSLREADIDPIVINTKPNTSFDKVPGALPDIPIVLNLYKGSRLPCLRTLRFAFTLPLPGLGYSLARHIAMIVEKKPPIDFVLADWGVGVLPEVALLQKHQATRNLPIILNMETFPAAWRAGLRESIEISMFRRFVDAITGFVIPTSEMLDFISKIAPQIVEKSFLLKPWYYPSCFYSQCRETSWEKRIEDSSPKVVFMGLFDLTRSLNDTRGQLLSLANSGIEIHCAQVEGMHHPKIRMFEPFNSKDLAMGAVAQFMQQYDACLVTYAIQPRRGGEGAVRFETSLPSRFLIAFGAGVPIILPKGQFQSMERFILQEGIGYAYTSPKDAYEALKNPEWKSVRRNALRKRKLFIFDPEHFTNWIIQLLPRNKP